ncbi:MAG: hypothetical protein KGL34_10590 [Gammaproteobacteria bacterium]|nr:hypothetical protein [Gammaproteobacteria bacterium]MDE2305999.1 hypothetical protein [Gammaproteobacteria bacterium]
MSKPPNALRFGDPRSWNEFARPDFDQSRRFLAESLSLLLADLLRSVLADASPALPADEGTVDRFRELADALEIPDSARPTGLGVTRAGLAKRCVNWLKLLLAEATAGNAGAAMREFLDALGLFPALFDSEPSARSRRARLTWLLTHDRRLDASTREAATALIEACEHLGVLLWPDAETA